MKKIPTYFIRDPENPSRVINQINPGCEWVLAEEGVSTRKWDGTACLIKNGVLFKRFDVKDGKHPPDGFIPCEPRNTGNRHWPGWVLVEPSDPNNGRHLEALKSLWQYPEDGTYELCGPKVNGNPEKLDKHVLLRHGEEKVSAPRTFEGLADWFKDQDIEGIVWHHPDGRMAKIKKKDFGYLR